MTEIPGIGDEYYILDDPDKIPRKLTVQKVEKKSINFGKEILHVLSFEESTEQVPWETTWIAQKALREQYSK